MEATRRCALPRAPRVRWRQRLEWGKNRVLRDAILYMCDICVEEEKASEQMRARERSAARK